MIEWPGVNAAFVRDNAFDVELVDKRVAATLSIAPFYDPKSERVRA